MADELTGPDEIVDEPEVQLVHEIVATPDEEAASAAPPPDDNLDRELAKHLNVDQLPADPLELKKLVTKRYTDLRTGMRTAQEERAERERELAELKGRVDALTAVASGQQPKPQPQLPEWAKNYQPPKGASDMEVLADFLQFGIQNTVGPELQQLKQVAYDMGVEKVNGWIAAAKEKAGTEDDWAVVEPHVQYALERGFDPDKALNYALAETGLIGDRIKREIAAQQSAKVQAVGGTVRTPGVTSTSTKGPGDPRKVRDSDWWAWAKEDSEQELARR